MQVKEVMTKKIIGCGEDEYISQVLSKMRQNKIHQIFVTKDNELKGMIVLNDIVKKEFNVSSTKAASVMKPVTTIRSNANLEDAVDLIINANVRALAVVDNKFVGVISETDIIKNVDIDFDVDQIAKSCLYVNDNDNVGKVKNMLVQKNISRVPIIKSNKLIGMVGTIELADLIEQGKVSKESRGWGLKGKGFKEKMSVDSTSVTSIMKEANYVRKPVKSSRILDMLKESEEVFITNGDMKIITPKDVLRLLIKPKKTTYFQISGLEDEDAMTVAKIHSIIEKTIKSIANVNEIQPMHMFIEHHKKQGGKTKYSIKAQLPTQLGTIIVSKVSGYNLITAMQEAMNNLDREFWKKYEKLKGKGYKNKRVVRGK